jgi:hypothetical protein
MLETQPKRPTVPAAPTAVDVTTGSSKANDLELSVIGRIVGDILFNGERLQADLIVKGLRGVGTGGVREEVGRVGGGGGGRAAGASVDAIAPGPVRQAAISWIADCRDVPFGSKLYFVVRSKSYAGSISQLAYATMMNDRVKWMVCYEARKARMYVMAAVTAYLSTCNRMGV